MESDPGIGDESDLGLGHPRRTAMRSAVVLVTIHGCGSCRILPVERSG